MTPQHNHKYSIIIVGFLLMLFLLWNRFIRVRLPKNLSEFSSDNFMILIAIMLMITFAVGILYNAKIVLNFQKKPDSWFNRILTRIGENAIINRLTTFLLTYLVNSPKTFYEHVVFQYVDVSAIIELPVSHLLVFMLRRPKSIIYIITNTIPKVLVSTIFLIDIFYFHKLHYFYISLVLLGIPVIVNCYRYMVNDLADKNNIYMLSHLEITPSNDPNFSNVRFRDKIPPIEDATDIVTRKNDQALLTWFVKNYDIYSNIKNFIIRIQEAEDFYKPYENLYIYSCYLLGWCYILSFSVLLEYENFLFLTNILDIEEPFSQLSLMIPDNTIRLVDIQESLITQDSLFSPLESGYSFMTSSFFLSIIFQLCLFMLLDEHLNKILRAIKLHGRRYNFRKRRVNIRRYPRKKLANDLPPSSIPVINKKKNEEDI